jgi:flavin reductase (DIM6/NTAB) family NADH-FMN oxidoreductase RutF
MEIEPKNFFKFLAPRPVALVTTVDPEGMVNAAPVSFMTPVSVQPPLIAISVGPDKEIIDNIRKTKSFVINIPPEGMLNQLWICSQNFPPGTDALKKANLTGVLAAKGKPPLVQECIVWFECDLEYEKVSGDHILVIAKVKDVTVKNDLVAKDGGIDIAKARSLMHIGGSKFTVAGKEIIATAKKENEK